MRNILFKKKLVILIALLFIGFVIFPSITGSNINYKFQDNSSKIINGGNNRGWSETEDVSGGSPFSSKPSLMVDNHGTVHVVWYAGYMGGFWILYNYKDAGGSWNDPETIESGGEDELSWCTPSLYAEDDGTVHVAWADTLDHAGSGSDYDILYKNRAVDGSWSDAEVVSTESTSDSDYPWIVVDTIGTVHIVWNDKTNYSGSDGDWDIYYKYKTGDGIWSDTEVVSTESINGSRYPSLDVDNEDTLHVIWQDKTDYAGSGEDCDIFYKHKTASGSWSDTEVVSTGLSNSSCLSDIIVEDDGTTHIAWSDSSDYQNSGSDFDIFYKIKTTDGSWSNTEVVSTECSDWSRKPSLAVENNGDVHVAWNDGTDYAGSGEDYDIFYKYKTAGGSWSNLEVVSTESTDSSYDPSLDVEDDGSVHVAWGDHTSPFGPKILYKYRISQNQPPKKPTIDGPRIGIKGTEYEYSFKTLDPDWDDVRFIIDWGDDNTEITDFYPPCTDVKVSHIWNEKGIYDITVQAEDTNGLISPKASLTVTMPRNRIVNRPFFSFLQTHPNMFPLLRHLLGL